MENKSTFQRYGAPVVVLVGICLVISAALALTYSVAAPRIEARAIADANAARQELLADADSFSDYEGELWASEDGKVAVTEVSVADNKSGIVVTVETSSFGGKLTEMIGIDADGAVTGVKVTDHADTPGVGTKAQAPEHLAQYVGVTELTNTNIKKDAAIDHVSGASVSSGAIHYGVYGALEQYKLMGGEL